MDVVCADGEIEPVRQFAGCAARIASVCTGAFLLAGAGLLDGRRATTHWSHARELQDGLWSKQRETMASANGQLPVEGIDKAVAAIGNVPELEVANGNAYALLETLGLDPKSVGELPVAELRQRLSDPRVRRRLDGDAQLSRYVPALLAMVAAKPTTSELSLAWA